MEIQGTITKILEPQTFNGKNGQVTRHSFVLNNNNQRYPKNIKFDVLGDDKWPTFDIQIGQTRTVMFDVESREWNGKWFTTCNVWGVKPLQQSYSHQPQARTEQPQVQNNTNIQPTNPFDSDAPF